MKKVLLGLFVALSIASCKKEYDTPPESVLAEGDILTIAELRGILDTVAEYKFLEDKSVYGIITADESTGNLYKQVFMEDATGAINLRLLSGGGLYEGDSIRVGLKGTILGAYNSMVQLDSVDVDINVIKQSTGHIFTPTSVTVNQINQVYQSRLVRITDCEFSSIDLNGTWADGGGQQSLNRTLVDCDGNGILLRSSGYANFADDVIPSGHGSIIAIVGQFNNDMQLTIRRPSEANMGGARCADVGNYFVEDFDAGTLTANNAWTTQIVTGTADWEWFSFGGGLAKINAGSNDTETWLISPSIDLSASIAPELNFTNALAGTGPALELLISTDYSGTGAPSSANWTPISFNLSSGGFQFTDGGPIDITAYKTSNTYIAFKYLATSSGGATWEVDEITISE